MTEYETDCILNVSILSYEEFTTYGSHDKMERLYQNFKVLWVKTYE